uniref:CYCLIN domain-containing protein n=1 Tax=Strongyloides stercoralis TaxID=6248 RepID=A0A0K0E1N1_STRER
MKLRRKKLNCQNNVNKNGNFHKRPDNINVIKKQKFKEKLKDKKLFLINIKQKFLKKSSLTKCKDIIETQTKDSEELFNSTGDIFDISLSSNEDEHDSYNMDNLCLELLNETGYNIEYIFNHIDDKDVLLHQMQLYENMVIYLMHINLCYPNVSIKTIFIAISLIDDIFRSQVINSKDAAIIGIACCFIASKFEDVLSLTLDDCVKLGNDQFSKKDICEFEQEILTVVQFRIIRSYSIEISRKILNIQDTKNSIKQICDVICICCTLSSLISSEKPSTIASCAILISYQIQKEEPDTELLQWLSYISNNEDRTLISIINEHMKTTIPSLYQKYHSLRNFINQIVNDEVFQYIIKSINF